MTRLTITKLCTSCLKSFPLESFRKQSGTKDGLQYECRSCNSNRLSAIYRGDPEILERNKQWQEQNKGKHNEAAKRYYHSPTGRLNRGLNKALDHFFGKVRPPFVEIVGTSASSLMVHLMTSLPEGITVEDYQDKWFVGFVKPPPYKFNDVSKVLDFFHWKNLCVKEKTEISEDLGVRFH